MIESGGILKFGAGYSDSMTSTHEANLADETVHANKIEFCKRYVEHALAIRDVLGSKTGRRVLALGSGIGFDVRRYLELGLDAYGLETADLEGVWKSVHGGEAWRFAVSEDGTPPFADGSFDLVASMNVLEHVGTIPPDEVVTEDTAGERRRFIEQGVRLLAPGGVLIVIAPNRAYGVDSGHIHTYHPGSREAFAECGMTPIDPFDARNFLPSREDVLGFVDEILDGPSGRGLSCFFLHDTSLIGEPPMARAPGWIREHRERAAGACVERLGTPRRVVDNPHLHLIIRREIEGASTPAPGLLDTGRDLHVVEDGGAWTAQWTRIGLTPVYRGRWTHAETGQSGTDRVLLGKNEHGLPTFTREISGRVYTTDRLDHGSGELSGTFGHGTPWVARSEGEARLERVR